MRCCAASVAAASPQLTAATLALAKLIADPAGCQVMVAAGGVRELMQCLRSGGDKRRHGAAVVLSGLMEVREAAAACAAVGGVNLQIELLAQLLSRFDTRSCRLHRAERHDGARRPGRRCGRGPRRRCGTRGAAGRCRRGCQPAAQCLGGGPAQTWQPATPSSVPSARRLSCSGSQPRPSPAPAPLPRHPRLPQHARPAPLRRLWHGSLLQRGLQPRTLARAPCRVPAPAGRARDSGGRQQQRCSGQQLLNSLACS